MRPWLKWTLIALPWGLLSLAGYAYVASGLRSFWDSSTQAHSMARTAFFADLAFEGCVGPDAVMAVAEARGWFHEVMDEPLHWCHAPVGLTDWIHVNVSPPLPFSNEGENAAYVGFDANGCMADWDYVSGPGSTCPDH